MLKKILLSLGIILSLGLVGCGNKQNAEKIAEQETKIEELEKKISTIEETADSSEKSTALPADEIDAILSDIESDTNKKILRAFYENELMTYSTSGEGAGQAESIQNYENGRPDDEGGLNFYINSSQDGVVVSVTNLSDADGVDQFIEWISNLETSKFIWSVNKNINSVLYFQENDINDDEKINQYIEVFESVE